MPKVKYILHSSCRLLPLKEIKKKKLPNVQEVRDILAEKLFVLEENGCWHLLNNTIKHFLAAFQTPTSLPQVIQQFAQMAGCQPNEIKPIMGQFFDNMIDRGFLIKHTQQLNCAPPKMNRAIFRKGQKIEDYKIIRQIYKNPDLEIYLGQHLEKLQFAAIKVLRTAEKASSKQQLAEKNAFLQEFKLMQELNGHPNVCQCYALVDKPSYTLGILSYVEGPGLRSFIKKQKPDLTTTLQLIEQILAAMSFVHQRKVLHGDIHLSNFIVDANSNRIILIDFNLSNREMPKDDEIIREGGVYQYIPPEKLDARAFQFVNNRSDYCSEVFQLGVVIYYMLYHDMPFDDFSWQALAKRILEDEPDYPLVTPQLERIPAFALNLLKKSLQKKPKERFSSAIQFYKTWQKERQSEDYVYEKNNYRSTAQ